MTKLWLILSLKILKVLVNVGRVQGWGGGRRVVGREQGWWGGRWGGGTRKNWGSRCFLLETSESGVDSARGSDVIILVITYFHIL